MSEESFPWPEDKRAAITLTFDDARESQLDTGIPVLNEFAVKASFYVSFPAFERRLEEWRQVAAVGHEIGNHTVSHPCSGNLRFSRERALENYTLEKMEVELTGANERIEDLTGVRPTTFAYPCGQTFVGRGRNCVSYVPLVARYFTVGRGFMDTSANHPRFMDLAQALGMNFDGASFEYVKGLIAGAIDDGGWLILVGHEIGLEGRQTVLVDALRAVCEFVADPANKLWIDTAASIGEYVKTNT